MSAETKTVETESGIEKSGRRRTGVKLRRINGARSYRKPGGVAANLRGRSAEEVRGES